MCRASTRPMLLTRAPDCKASEIFYISSENYFVHVCQYFCEVGQVPILRYFAA